MYLKRLEIYGFKSFGSKSVLDFDENEKNKISAVVGPNGSGKSNIADAVRWVLGEQSGKLIRSKKNEDVIFCGSSTKARSSYAEVAIVLSNEREVEIEINNKKYKFTEIEVARKLYRSGESEYQINKKKVRLLDVQQLLATLGFGQSSYTVIGQGMVDRLLFFNAAERKVLFDEAAGVKQYEIKREQAIRKLQGTDANLIRLSDILTELEPRVVNLRRLVKRAEGRKEIEQELVNVQSLYYVSLEKELKNRVSLFSNEKSTLNKKIEQSNIEIEKLSEEINKSQSSNEHNFKLKEIEDKLSVVTIERDQLMQKVANMEALLNQENQRAQSLRHEKSKLNNDNTSLEEKISFLSEKIRTEKSEIDSLEVDLNNKKKELENFSKEKVRLDESLANLADVQDLTALEKLKQEVSTKETQKRDFTTKLFALQQQLAQQENEKRTRENRLAVLASKLTEVTKEQDIIESELKKAKNLKNHDESLLVEKKISLSKQVEAVEKVESEIKEVLSGLNQDEIESFEIEVKNVYRELKELSSSGEKSKLEIFFKKLHDVFGKIEKLTKSLNKTNRSKLEADLQAAKSDMKETEAEVNSLSFALEKGNNNIQRLVEKIDASNLRQKELRSEMTDLASSGNNVVNEKEITEYSKMIEKLEDILEKLRLEIAEKSRGIDEKKHVIVLEKSKLQENENTLRRTTYELELKVSRLKNTLENQERELGQANSKLQWTKRRLVELADLEKQNEKTEDQGVGTLKSELSLKNENLAKLRQEMSAILNEQRESSQVVFELERKRRAAENEMMNSRNELNRIELDEAKYATRLEDLEEELRISEIKIDRSIEAKKLDQAAKDSLRVKMENLRRRLETIGGVDPETVAEYEELEKRSTEMSAQVTDLENAKSDLEKIIKELDTKIKKQFSETFVHIATEFNRYFQILFNGGKATLTLGEDEEGNYGIEITANPPGKKIQSLNALSGGERTLTSLALVFAILSINPSPFCVLDEVDAALDEANTLRFSKILEDLECKTQFIVISHNRETMKVASSLYGITMDSDHISKMISIRLTEALETVS